MATGLSRFNYVHITKKGYITVGIKGQKQARYKKSDILSAIHDVSVKTINLGQSLSKNDLFPEDLMSQGLEGVSLLQKLPRTLTDIADKVVTIKNSERIKDIIQDVLQMGEDEEYFKSRFYERVAKYYGINRPWKEVEQLAKKGALKSPVSTRRMKMRKGKNGQQSDPKPLQKWILEHDKNNLFDEQTIRVIDDVYYLKEIAQKLEEIAAFGTPNEEELAYFEDVLRKKE